MFIEKTEVDWNMTPSRELEKPWKRQRIDWFDSGIIIDQLQTWELIIWVETSFELSTDSSIHHFGLHKTTGTLLLSYQKCGELLPKFQNHKSKRAMTPCEQDEVVALPLMVMLQKNNIQDSNQKSQNQKSNYPLWTRQICGTAVDGRAAKEQHPGF